MTDNDDLPTQELPEVLMGDAEEILLDLIDLISKAANVPLSSTPRIDREEVIALLEDAIACLPHEVREARFMLKEKETTHIDEINIRSGLSSSAIAVAILNLELQGVVATLPGKLYRLN